MNSRIWTGLVILLSLLLTTPVNAEITPHVRDARVVGVNTESEEEVWSIQHRSIDIGATAEIVPPLKFQGVWYYAVGGDLMTLDVAQGVIKSRKQYPAIISKLLVRDAALFVQLDVKDASLGASGFVEVPAAGRAPQGAWNSFFQVGLRAQNDVPKALRDLESIAKHEGDWSQARAELRAMEVRDPTNPLLPAYRGLAAQRDGDTRAADEAFAKALNTLSPWNERIGLCALLDLANRPAEADSACDAAKTEMKSSGLNPEAITSLVLFVIVGQRFGDAMRAAIEAKDTARADRIGIHIYEFFPNLEGSVRAWRVLVEWLKASNEPELAKAWTLRAEETQRSASFQAMQNETRWTDLWLLLLVASMLVLPLAGFATGIRPRGTHLAGWRGWLPKMRIIEVIACLALVALIVFFSTKVKDSVNLIGLAAEIPVAVLQGGMASPDVGPWLESLSESPERAALLLYHEESLNAAKAGVQAPESPALDDVFTALQKTAGHQSMQERWEREASEGIAIPSNPLPLAIPGLLSFLFFATAGIGLRRLLPKLASAARIVVLGSTNPVLAILLNFAFLAGFLRVFTPLGSLLQSIATPAYEKYFGMDVLQEFSRELFDAPVDNIWPWAAMGSAIVLHAAILLLWPQQKREQEDS